ncbi:hypothetical protein E2542_SST19265 [Spatholobus suberectus]|nr:hypothetical protein E2542_SST19265 [Spatholobus suberectus]
MCSMISAQGVVVATAMAVSGTVILLALRLQKSFPPPQFPLHQISPPPILRSCISPAGNKSKKKKKKQKRVHFAEDVVESRRDGEEFRRSNARSKLQKSYNNGDAKSRAIPANRVALYNGILRDRVAQRLAYSC